MVSWFKNLRDKNWLVKQSGFVPFSSNEKGLGVDLVFCKDLVEKNNGTIKVDSTLNEGSTFTFSIKK